MDPNTTLVTFMLQTRPSVKSVHLVGSWDNFSKFYPMDRDSRRDRGQWKGCYVFKDIICDDQDGIDQKRNGGLMMGRTYYYYYELDGSYETHDTSLPSTNTCPYLPGQTVNMLYVPVQHTLRQRSASLSSMRHGDFMTMNPGDKFVSPRAAPPIPSSVAPRLLTSHPRLAHKASARSLSPAPSWRRRFFARRSNSRDVDESRDPPSLQDTDDARSVSSRGSRSRDISPESLRRFLSDDNLPLSPSPEEKPCLTIPEDIAEELEDDDNFATSATAEVLAYPTSLSPPPPKRSSPSNTDSAEPCFSTSAATTANGHELSPRADLPVDNEVHTLRDRLEALAQFDLGVPQSRFSFSTVSSTGSSPEDTENDVYPFYDSLDEDVTSIRGDENVQQSHPPSSPHGVTVKKESEPISSYSLPHSAAETKPNITAAPAFNTSEPPVLPVPIDAGLGDLVSELGWIVGVIQDKGH